MIELTDVTRRYGRKGAAPDALRAVSLLVPAASVWAVIGPNGAGKSTLLSLLLGFIRPTSGTVTLDGNAPRDYLRDHGAGYLPERFSLPARWTVHDALRVLARLDRGADIDRAVALCGLEAHLHRRIGELSRGLLQRTGLAQVLLARHPLVVLDEPTEGLDPVWRIRLRDILTDLRAHGCTIIIASHDIGEVERTADRAVLLDRGTVRDILETRLPATTTSYRVRLAAPVPALHEAFPDATSEAGPAFTCEVGGAEELTARLGALIALGAVIEAVEPLQRPLEQRVRDALGDA
ncbi:MAG TPA: ABC transporter ATP-binding protein [Longimicrobiales bacterium]|nr:ABC transporter ATP-binding protein [Longimicrobiales bacterium]